MGFGLNRALVENYRDVLNVGNSRGYLPVRLPAAVLPQTFWFLIWPTPIAWRWITVGLPCYVFAVHTIRSALSTAELPSVPRGASQEGASGVGKRHLTGVSEGCGQAGCVLAGEALKRGDRAGQYVGEEVLSGDDFLLVEYAICIAGVAV